MRADRPGHLALTAADIGQTAGFCERGLGMCIRDPDGNLIEISTYV